MSNPCAVAAFARGADLRGVDLCVAAGVFGADLLFVAVFAFAFTSGAGAAAAGTSTFFVRVAVFRFGAAAGATRGVSVTFFFAGMDLVSL